MVTPKNNDPNYVAPPVAASKTEWRSWARTMRRELQQCGQLTAINDAIIKHLLEWPVFQEATTVLSYAPIGHELDLRPLMQMAPDKHWYFPRTHVSRDGVHSMTFHRVHSTNELYVMNQASSGLAIPEPHPDAPQLNTQPDLVLLPALSADHQGTRLGYGKGFYDRWLNQYKGQVQGVVLVPNVLRVTQLPSDSWDIVAQTCITERGVIASR